MTDEFGSEEETVDEQPAPPGVGQAPQPGAVPGPPAPVGELPEKPAAPGPEVTGTLPQVLDAPPAAQPQPADVSAPPPAVPGTPPPMVAQQQPVEAAQTQAPPPPVVQPPPPPPAPPAVRPPRPRAVTGPAPDFLEGSEVAASRRFQQPGFEGQLSLLEPELELRKKFLIAMVVISSVFFAGMIAGAVLGLFI